MRMTSERGVGVGSRASNPSAHTCYAVAVPAQSCPQGSQDRRAYCWLARRVVAPDERRACLASSSANGYGARPMAAGWAVGRALKCVRVKVHLLLRAGRAGRRLAKLDARALLRTDRRPASKSSSFGGGGGAPLSGTVGECESVTFGQPSGRQDGRRRRVNNPVRVHSISRARLVAAVEPLSQRRRRRQSSWAQAPHWEPSGRRRGSAALVRGV
jgi:hypothetical protein